MTWRQPVVLLLFVGVVAVWLWQAPTEQTLRFPMPTNKVYVQECGSCHTAFAPGTLPARSWRLMMANLSDHFGEDASMEEPYEFAILKELETFASDGNHADMRMQRISASISSNAAPQEFSKLPYFVKLHDELAPNVWQRKKVGVASNCIACHSRANEGRYDELEVRIPAG
jgi:hypothetical protein